MAFANADGSYQVIPPAGLRRWNSARGVCV